MLLFSRLKRIRQRNEFTRAGQAAADACATDVQLFEDCALIDWDDRSFILRTIERIVLIGDYGCKDYKLPVPINSDKKDILEVKVSIYCRIHKGEGECYPRFPST